MRWDAGCQETRDSSLGSRVSGLQLKRAASRPCHGPHLRRVRSDQPVRDLSRWLHREETRAGTGRSLRPLDSSRSRRPYLRGSFPHHCETARLSSAKTRRMGGRLPIGTGGRANHPAPVSRDQRAGPKLGSAARACYNMVVRELWRDRRAATLSRNLHLAPRRVGKRHALRKGAATHPRRPRRRATPTPPAAPRRVRHTALGAMGARVARAGDSGMPGA
jgi:hypothetical protein